MILDNFEINFLNQIVFLFLVAALMPPYVPSSASSADEQDLPQQQYLFVEEGFLMKTSSLGQQGSRLAFSEGLIHQVKEGDSIPKIAARYGVSADTIRWANGLTTGSSIRPGQELLILPVDGVLHVVRRGQTLSRIAQLYDIPVDTIIKQNRIKGGFIVAGEQLIIPGGKPVTGASAVASINNTLQFADALPSKDIQLQINGREPTTPAVPGRAPVVGVVLTQTLLQMPCQNCNFTQRYHPGHYAVDIQTKGGGPIFAAEAGTVIRADNGWNGGFGNVIEIDHGNGLVTLYGHNKELYVKAGDSVTRGQVIAEMGNTGLVHGPTGIHVHFEVRSNGVKRNPELYLE
jgi:murein DD-endopeptidase MepM/ murein hydrolase activator NlpD